MTRATFNELVKELWAARVEWHRLNNKQNGDAMAIVEAYEKVRRLALALVAIH